MCCAPQTLKLGYGLLPHVWTMNSWREEKTSIPLAQI